MRKNVVICMNMQVSYFSTKGSSYLGEESKVIKERIISELKTLCRDEFAVIHTRNVRSPQDTFYAHEKTQNTVGTLDINMVDGLGKSDGLLVSATRPSALWKTPLLSELKKHDPEVVYLIGAETNCSVLFTAYDLKNLGYSVKVIEPLTVSRDSYLQNAAVTLLADSVGVDMVSGF